MQRVNWTNPGGGLCNMDGGVFKERRARLLPQAPLEVIRV